MSLNTQQVCFTYGTWFGIEGLIAAGESPEAPSVQRALEFLLKKQNPNGGWGESYVACVNKAYNSDGTGAVRKQASKQKKTRAREEVI